MHAPVPKEPAIASETQDRNRLKDVTDEATGHMALLVNGMLLCP